MLAISIAFLGIGSVLMKEYLYHHNGIVKVDTRQALPMSHFAAMGITGDGDYNVTDMFNSANIKDPEARNKASLRLIKERFINQGGILGYEKFLIHKQIKNSADGSMAWGHEVYYLKAFHPNNEQLEKTFPRHYFLEKNGIATEGKFDFRTVQQIFWIIALVLILGSIFDQSLWGLFLKISAVGFFAFWLIFEGGRTRYLIQFLPVLFLLASLGMQRGINYVAQIRRNKQG
ncbi:putative membrane protein [Fructobacillus tropaeoli]|uniref:Putative membrane protein n=2 Tax=Fructobacillus tropaeoli TaxID=709323 RepID=A0A3F3H0B3_9LACO|nr:putative membrane protein [Fructobacillus tropaeoli]